MKYSFIKSALASLANNAHRVEMAYCFNANYLVLVSDIYRTQQSYNPEYYFKAIFTNHEVVVSADKNTPALDSIRKLFYKDKGSILIPRKLLFSKDSKITIEINPIQQ